MTEVRLKELTKRYDGKRPAVADLSLSIPAGKITALLGPSGCGKTTILKLIAGLLAPDAGDVAFDGQSVARVPPERRGAAMVFQNHLLFPTMNVFDNVAFGLKMVGVPRPEIKQRVQAMLEMVRLPEHADRHPRQLSGGQQQRVALARALVIRPRLLLLDEPLSNLDAHLRDEMRELILELQRQLAITTVVVTHDQEEAVILGDRIALIFAGRLQQEGAPPVFYEQPASARVARFFGGVNFIPAIRAGRRVESCWGTFETRPSPLPDGPVLMTIRPEQMEIRPANGNSPGANTLPGRILGGTYAGTHTRFKIQVAGAGDHLLLHGMATGRPSHQGRVSVYLPPEKIWLLPEP